VLTEEEITQIFFYSDRPRLDAVLAIDIDLVQFARNIEAYVLARVNVPGLVVVAD
jgi:hypothetical protein